MGREAYLTRVTLGRSAFEEPLRDEHGEFILGGNTRRFDDINYQQQWNERGHPYNPTTERLAKQFAKAQNEVLAACGVVVRKGAAEKKKQKKVRRVQNHQLEVLNQENKVGFMLKCFDELHGDTLTWWIRSARRRILTFGPAQSLLSGAFDKTFSTSLPGFLFSGFPASIVSGISRLIRRPELSEPIEYMNYLQFHLARTDLETPWQDRAWEWAEKTLMLSLEIPFDMVASLQSLGFTVLPVIWSWLKDGTFKQCLEMPRNLAMPLPHLILLYMIRDHLHHEIGWRILGLIRQTLIRPHRPTKLSIQAAEQDEFIEDMSIVGIGRKLGTHSDRRYYGAQSFWKALPIAFPWLSFLCKSDTNEAEVKIETLARCRMMERDAVVYQGHRTRATNIVSNLESLDVDVEEDFFVDIDQWERDIDFLRQRTTFDPIFPSIERARAEEATSLRGGILTEPTSDGEDFLTTAQERHAAERQEQANIVRLQQDGEFLEEQENLQPMSLFVPLAEDESGQTTGPTDAPSTPEMGIRRATSLSTTAPRPVRRPTETIEHGFDDEIEAVLAEARREQVTKSKRRAKDHREFRMTRLTTHVADSLAWHASAVITSFLLLPIDAIYYRSLAGWFVGVTDMPEPKILLVNEQSGGMSWSYQQTLLLSLGVECLVRGVIWQVGSQVALYYGRKFEWGEF